ncbi:MAG: response regulator, partial [Clostridia bacterium]|nr:response regulator [Clostridia bacterium]
MDEARGRALAAGFSRGIGEAAAALGALGYASVARARDGASALRMIAEAEPEVAVCDAVLPGMDGAALIERIRRLRTTRRW